MPRKLALAIGLCASAQLAPHSAQAHDEGSPAAPPSARIEMISDVGLAGQSEFRQQYHTVSHTLANQVGQFAAAVDVKTVVLCYGLFYGTREELVTGEAARHFNGKVVLATDLDLFE